MAVAVGFDTGAETTGFAVGIGAVAVAVGFGTGTGAETTGFAVASGTNGFPVFLI